MAKKTDSPIKKNWKEKAEGVCERKTSRDVIGLSDYRLAGTHGQLGAFAGVVCAVQAGITDEYWMLIGTVKAIDLILEYIESNRVGDRVSVAYRARKDHFIVGVCRGSGDIVARYN